MAGIDTHKHTHHVAILDRLGRDVADREFVTTSSGYAQIIEFFRAHGLVDEVGVEGTGSYGAGIAPDVTAIDDQLEQIVRAVNPTLLSLRGVGPVTAATLLVAAGDNPDRLTTRAAFVALAGVAPIPASSGQRTRHRLSRGGNRQANAALHRIMLLRIRHQEPRTTAYVQRRRAEGLTNRDIARCLKRHIANEIYKALLNPTADQPGHHLRSIRQQAGVPVSALARTLGVQHQRLRRLETGIRADAELEQRALATLAQITTKSAA